MMTGQVETKPPGYSHTQRAPLCVLLYALAFMFLTLSWLFQDTPPIHWLYPPIGLLMVVLAASFHNLSVVDQRDALAIRFGPVPMFRRIVRYSGIESVEVGRTLVLDGWGIHLNIRGGWVWNLWGRTCVVVRFKNGGTLRIGTDDADNLARFVEEKIRELKT